jgi:DNA-nicking Smr family endonuclease
MGRFKARRGGKKERPSPPDSPQAQPGARSPRPPEIFLRKCTYAEAMHRLEQQVRAHVAQGRREILVVHGKGRGSPEGQGVLGDAVREWCLAHPQLVCSWRSAPPAWGGDGAVVLELGTRQS